jgi:glucosamine--fructose-6-phosphate aminotransferase (isomerizing)
MSGSDGHDRESEPETAVEAEADVRTAAEATQTWREASTAEQAVSSSLLAAWDLGLPALDRLRGAETVVFIGAGSSYYLAQTMAWAWPEIVGRRAVAAPLSELLLRPRGALGPTVGSRAFVVISRSGTTSEAVAAARWARSTGATTIGVTCRANSPLVGVVDEALVSLAGDETAIVMTRSFTSMLAGLLGVAVAISGDDALRRELDALAALFADQEVDLSPAWRLAARPWSRVVVLGGGARLGIAREACLKIIETSQLDASAYEPLEFRHGPISVCEPGVLVVGLLGDAAAHEEQRVLDECAALGATIWAPAPGPALHPLLRLPLLMPPLQALALGIAVRRGRDPDRPRHLTQVVVLS